MSPDGPQDPMQPWIDMEIEADMERVRRFQPGLRVKWGPLGYLPRSAEVYVGWTIRFRASGHR